MLTPPAGHAPVAIQAAEAGCHVLVEKPMALDVAEADRMIAAARRAGVRLIPNHNYLFKPSIQRARELVESGAIGEVVAVNSFYGVSGERSSYGAAAGRSHWAWALPGGVFTNFLPHLAYLQLEFLGVGARVVDAAYGGDHDPTELTVLLRGDSAVGTMTVSLRTKPYMKFVEIYGTAGIVHADLVRETAYVHRDRRLPSVAAKVAHNVGLAAQVTAATASTSAKVLTGRMPRMPELHVILAQLYESLERGEETPTTAEQGRDVARMLEEVRAALPSPAPPPPPPELQTDPRTAIERRVAKSGQLRSRVLVTGATGFLGRRLAKALVRCGARPVLLVRNAAKVAPELADHVDIVHGDVRDPVALAEATKDVDAVFHCAAVTTNKAPASVHEEINVEATGLVVQAAGEAGARRVVHTSSVVVYGLAPPGGAADEETPLDRSVSRWDHYLRTKVAAEDLAREQAARFEGLELVIVRLGLLYGPDRPPAPGIAPVGPFHLLMGAGRNRLPYTHVDDAVDALLLAAIVDEAADQAYNVVGEVPLSVRAIVSAGNGEIHRARSIGVPRLLLLAGARLLERRAAASGTEVPPRLTGFVVRSATRDVSYDTQKARSQLGWEPSTSLDAELRRSPGTDGA